MKIFSLLLMFASLTMVGCGPHFYRSSSLDRSYDDVFNELNNLKKILTSDNDAAGVQTVNAFITLAQSEDATLYYAEAPGAMGEMDQVFGDLFPGDLANDPTTFGNVTNMKAFFAVTPRSDGIRGGLLMAGDDGVLPTNFQALPGPNGNTNTATNGNNTGNNNGNGPTTTPKANTSSRITFVFVGLNETGLGSPGLNMALPPAMVSDEEFSMDLNLKNLTTLTLRSRDIVEGELADVIQLELFKSDNNGSEGYVGLLNMAVPQ